MGAGASVAIREFYLRCNGKRRCGKLLEYFLLFCWRQPGFRWQKFSRGTTLALGGCGNPLVSRAINLTICVETPSLFRHLIQARSRGMCLVGSFNRCALVKRRKMATFGEDLEPCVVVSCFECGGPVRHVIYRHQCDVRMWGQSPGYCFSCMAARGVCKHCNDCFTRMFHSLGLRGSPQQRRAWMYPPSKAQSPKPPSSPPPSPIQRFLKFVRK